jgi:hypothetical protein
MVNLIIFLRYFAILNFNNLKPLGLLFQLPTSLFELRRGKSTQEDGISNFYPL